MAEKNLGALADAIYEQKAKIATAEQVVKDLQKEKTSLEDQILALMQEAGTTSVRGKKALISLSDKAYPSIADWEALSAFIIRRKCPHLLQRRISEATYKELKDALGGKAIPGTSEYIKTSISVTKA